jgi:hypothetical protein
LKALRKMFMSKETEPKLVSQKDDFEPCIWLRDIEENPVYPPTICVPQKNGNGDYFWLPPMQMKEFLAREKVPRLDGQQGDEHTARFYSGRTMLVFSKVYEHEGQLLFGFSMYNYSILRHSAYGGNNVTPNFNVHTKITMSPMDEDEEREEMEREKLSYQQQQYALGQLPAPVAPFPQHPLNPLIVEEDDDVDEEMADD